jgi:acetyltransferase
MSIRNLQHLFAPGSVAVIGASDRPGSVGATVYRNVLAGGFDGRIFAVNARHATVAKRPAYARIGELPEPPELAVICTPAATVPGLIGELGRAGTRAAVVLSAGLGAPGADGSTLRQQMLDAARPWLLRVLGPNCLGLLVPGIGLNASFAPTSALPGRLAFVSQSGALVTAVLDWASPRNIGFSSFVSVGDGSDVDVGDLLDYLAADPHTDAILLYMEGVRQARKFMSAARSAARSKPTLVVKAGRVAQAAQAAFSHTGAMAGADLVYDAALRRAGMLRVFSTDQLFDAVAVLARVRQPQGARLAIVTNGGGPGVMATDALVAGGGELAALSGTTVERLARQLPATWSNGNPVDIIGDASATRYAAALEVLLDASETDAVLLLHAPTAIVASEAVAAGLLPLLRVAGKPVLTCWLGGRSVAAARRLCLEAGVPVFDTPEGAVQGFLQLLQYRRNQLALMEVPAPLEEAAVDRERARAAVDALLARGTLQAGEADSKEILSAYGIPVAVTAVVTDAEGALAAASRIGYPIVLKLLSPDVVHKSDVGGVVLDIDHPAALRAALADMGKRVAAARPGARIAGYTVQQMIRRPRAVELIAGLTTDPVFGPVILFGQGGVAVEVTADQAIGLPPLNRLLARELVSRTRVARLLAGYRDRLPAHMDALCDVLVRIGQMAADLPELAELDINPLLADSAGVIALDARMRFAPASCGQALDRLAILPYPSRLERQVDWAGETLTIRPVRPEDGRAYGAFFAALTPEDVHFRMFTPLRVLSSAQLARFTQIDYAREMAFVAIRGAAATAELLGVARVVADPDNVRGEFAVTVRSDLKGRGLGALLLRCLLDYCRASGLTEVWGTALPDNVRMLALARTAGFEARRDDDLVVLRLVLRSPS